MRRRNFLAGIVVAMLPLAARAQKLPTVGILYSGSLDLFREELVSLQAGLGDGGRYDGKNVVLEVRSAEGDFGRLASLADALVGRPVAVIISASNVASAVAAKAATRTVPIVFFMGGDPVALGIVESLSHPGGNITGVTTLASDLIAKRLELLHELVPAKSRIAYLVNPANPAFNEEALRRRIDTSRGLGLQLSIARASNPREIDGVFANFGQDKVQALLIGPDTFFQSQRDRIVSLTARHMIPAIYPGRDYVAAGGLISYDGDGSDAYRRIGVYVARILNGEEPKNLPVQQATKFRLAINLKTAKTIGLEVPPALIARADEVIE